MLTITPSEKKFRPTGEFWLSLDFPFILWYTETTERRNEEIIMKLRTGVCSTDYESPSHLPYAAHTLFAKMYDAGFGAVQLAFSSVMESHFVPTGSIEIPDVIPEDAITAIKNAAEIYGIPVIAVNGTFNMAHPDASVRAEGIRRFPAFCRAAKVLGASFVTLCSGTRNPDNLWSPHPDTCADDAWRDMRDTVTACTKIAEEYDLTLAIESEAANVICTPARARQIMDEVGSPHLKMILDCANLFHAGRAQTEYVRETIDEALAYYGHDIVLAHGKDIRAGRGIDFCATGLGIVDFTYTAQKLREYGFAGEMFLHGIYDEDDMIRAREHWEHAAK